MGKIVVEQLNEEQKQELQIPDRPVGTGPWAVWECEPSTFDWRYDSVEKAYVFEGKVTVKTADQEVEIKAGDYVTFPKDLACTWTVQQKIKKVYQFE